MSGEVGLTSGEVGPQLSGDRRFEDMYKTAVVMEEKEGEVVVEVAPRTSSWAAQFYLLIRDQAGVATFTVCFLDTPRGT